MKGPHIILAQPGMLRPKSGLAYNRKCNVLSASLNKTCASFFPYTVRKPMLSSNFTWIQLQELCGMLISSARRRKIDLISVPSVQRSVAEQTLYSSIVPVI